MLNKISSSNFNRKDTKEFTKQYFG